MRAFRVTALLSSFGLLSCGTAVPQPAPPPPSAAAAASAKPAPLSPSDRLKRGFERLEASQYAASEEDFSASLNGRERDRALVGLAQVQMVTGRYDEAVQTAGKLGHAEPTIRGEAAFVRGECLRRQGKLQEAEAALREVTDLPAARRARLALGEVLLEAGRRQDAEPVLMTLVEDYNAERIRPDDGRALAMVGRAAHLLRSPQDANDAFDEAERALEGDVTTLLWRAELFLEKYDPGHAEQVTQEALKKAPHHPEALVSMAHVKLDQAFDFDAAERLSRQALRVNPKLAGAHFVLAGIALRDMELGLADQRLDAGLKHNPRNLDLLSLKAAVRFLADDASGFEDAKRKVLELNPNYSRMYQIIGEYAEWEHRYDEIVEMMRDAVVLDREDARARATLGLNLIRAGNDDEGVQQLRRAFHDDPFNVRVYNTLNLFEKVIPKQYETVEHAPFRVRYYREEKDLLERYVPQLLREAWNGMVGRYGFTPQTPVGVELYAERQDFSIRTSGLPNTGIQGVCFGHTLAAVSPRHESFNLGMTLWHELAHVFHIQLSQSHVPRWFTEGLAEYETLAARPEWRREQDPALYDALRAGRLPKVAAMNRAFTRAEHMEDMATAYYGSTQILVMLEERRDAPTIARLMRLWGEGKRTPEVVQEGLGMSADELDRTFRKYLEQKLARYATQFVPWSRPDLLERAKKLAEQAPTDPDRQARYALAALYAGKLKVARGALDQALKADPKHAQALWLRVRVAIKQQNRKAGEQALRAMLAAGYDGYAVQMAQAELASARRDVTATVAALEAAHRFDPSMAEPLAMMAKLARLQGRSDDELEALRQLARLEEHDAGTYRRLLEILVERKLYGEAADVGEAAVYVDVNGLRTHQLYATALAARKQTKQAIFELESAVLCEGRPAELADAHAQLAQALLAAGQRQAARRHAKQARELDPNNPRLSGLRI